MRNLSPGILAPASYFFNGVITANQPLALWAKKNLNSPNVQYIKNFIPSAYSSNGDVTLRGGETFKIICVANLRPEKDHLNLLRAFHQILKKNSHVSLHLIGRDKKDTYSESIKNYIKSSNLEENVFIYGVQENVPQLLKFADLGILSSYSEGLPVALLEYGMAGLPIVCTKVGDIEEIVGAYGKLVPPQDSSALADAILQYIEQEGLRKIYSAKFHERIRTKFSEEVVVEQILSYYKVVLTGT